MANSSWLRFSRPSITFPKVPFPRTFNISKSSNPWNKTKMYIYIWLFWGKYALIIAIQLRFWNFGILLMFSVNSFSQIFVCVAVTVFEIYQKVTIVKFILLVSIYQSITCVYVNNKSRILHVQIKPLQYLLT